MLGQPHLDADPEVVGFKLTGKLREGATATDLVLTVTQMLRKKGVVNKFVEFYGPGLDELPLADRATIANMAPEYGATCGFFPIDAETLRYLQGHRPQRRARRPGRGLCQGAGPVAHRQDARSGLHRHAGARSRPRRAQPRRPEAPAGPRAAVARGRGVQVAAEGRTSPSRTTATSACRCAGADYEHRPWRRGDRRHHLLHQHLQPQRHARRRPASRATR